MGAVYVSRGLLYVCLLLLLTALTHAAPGDQCRKKPNYDCFAKDLCSTGTIVAGSDCGPTAVCCVKASGGRTPSQTPPSTATKSEPRVTRASDTPSSPPLSVPSTPRGSDAATVTTVTPPPSRGSGSVGGSGGRPPPVEVPPFPFPEDAPPSAWLDLLVALLPLVDKPKEIEAKLKASKLPFTAAELKALESAAADWVKHAGDKSDGGKLAVKSPSSSAQKSKASSQQPQKSKSALMMSTRSDSSSSFTPSQQGLSPQTSVSSFTTDQSFNPSGSTSSSSFPPTSSTSSFSFDTPVGGKPGSLQDNGPLALNAKKKGVAMTASRAPGSTRQTSSALFLLLQLAASSRRLRLRRLASGARMGLWDGVQNAIKGTVLTAIDYSVRAYDAVVGLNHSPVPSAPRAVEGVTPEFSVDAIPTRGVFFSGGSDRAKLVAAAFVNRYPELFDLKDVFVSGLSGSTSLIKALALGHRRFDVKVLSEAFRPDSATRLALHSLFHVMFRCAAAAAAAQVVSPVESGGWSAFAAAFVANLVMPYLLSALPEGLRAALDQLLGQAAVGVSTGGIGGGSLPADVLARYGGAAAFLLLNLHVMPTADRLLGRVFSSTARSTQLHFVQLANHIAKAPPVPEGDDSGGGGEEGRGIRSSGSGSGSGSGGRDRDRGSPAAAAIAPAPVLVPRANCYIALTQPVTKNRVSDLFFYHVKAGGEDEDVHELLRCNPKLGCLRKPTSLTHDQAVEASTGAMVVLPMAMGLLDQGRIIEAVRSESQRAHHTEGISYSDAGIQDNWGASFLVFLGKGVYVIVDADSDGPSLFERTPPYDQLTRVDPRPDVRIGLDDPVVIKYTNKAGGTFYRVRLGTDHSSFNLGETELEQAFFKRVTDRLKTLSTESPMAREMKAAFLERPA